MSEKAKAKIEPTFEESFNELQSILRELNDSQVPLDKLVEKYSRARICLETCRKRLGDAELQVKKLAGDNFELFGE